jgi:hypothetical protein
VSDAVIEGLGYSPPDLQQMEQVPELVPDAEPMAEWELQLLAEEEEERRRKEIEEEERKRGMLR